jgi:hypothetical protein
MPQTPPVSDSLRDTPETLRRFLATGLVATPQRPPCLRDQVRRYVEGDAEGMADHVFCDLSTSAKKGSRYR